MDDEKIDVLGILERVSRRYAAGSRAGQEIRDVRAAVTELIEAAEGVKGIANFISAQLPEYRVGADRLTAALARVRSS